MNVLHEWGGRIDWGGLYDWLKRIADPGVLPIAIMSGLVLASVAGSFLANARAKAMARNARDQSKALEERLTSALDEAHARVESLGIELEEVRQSTLLIPNAPRPGFNLSKRSQALRMYRRGDPPDRIATELGVSRQEVDLLLKVHRIVIKNL